MKHYIIYIFILIVFIAKDLKILIIRSILIAIILSRNKLIMYSKLNFQTVTTKILKLYYRLNQFLYNKYFFLFHRFENSFSGLKYEH